MPIQYPSPYSSTLQAAVPQEPTPGLRLTHALQLPRQEDPWAFKNIYYPPPGARDPRNDDIPTIAAWPTPFNGPHDLDRYGRETNEMRLAYEELYRMEPSLRSAVQGKLASVLSLDVTIVPQDEDDKLQQRISKFVHWSVDRLQMGWEGFARKVFEPGFLQGWSFTELIFGAVEDDGRYAGLWTLRDAKSKDTDKLRLRLDAYRNVAGVVSTIRGLQEYPTWKGVLYSHNSMYENPFGTSDVRSAHRACKLIDAAYQLWYATLKNFSAPFLKGKYQSNVTRQQLELAMQRAKAGGWITIHKDDEVEVIDLAAAGSFDAFERKVDKLRQEIYLAIRGAYLPFLEGSAKDARGDTGVNKMASNDVEMLLAKLMGRVLTHQYILPIVRANFGERVPPPKMIFGGMNWNETKAQLDAADTVVNKLKIPISADWVRKIAQIPGPKDQTDVCGAPQQQPGAPGIPGQPPGPGSPPAGGPQVPVGGPQPTQPGSPGQQPPADNGGLSGGVADEQNAARVADMFAEVPGADPDWALAVFSAQMDSTGHDFESALKNTQEILRQNPEQPDEAAGGEVQHFSWSAGQSKGGHVKAIGSGPQAGQVLYGTEAERALAGQNKAAATQSTGASATATGNPSTSATKSPESSPAEPAKENLWAKTKAVKNRVASAAATVDAAIEGKAGVPYSALRTAVSMLHHAMMSVMGQTQKLAIQAARERGVPETKVEAIANIITVADIATSFALSKGGLFVTGGNVPASFVAGMMPSASLGYLAYSTARNPIATIRAAKKLVAGKIAPAGGQPQATHSNMSAEPDATDRRETYVPPEVLAALVHMAGVDDWDGVDELSQLASDPEGLQDFLDDDAGSVRRFSKFDSAGGWTASQTKTGRIKAVWSGGGKSPLYGKRAEEALRAKKPAQGSDSTQGGQGAAKEEESKPSTSAEPDMPRTASGKIDTRQLLVQRKAAAEPARQAARDAWGKAVNSGAKASELPALTEHLHKLTRDELREISRGLEQKVGGLKADLVKRLVEHAATKAESLDFNIEAMDQGKTGQLLRNQPDRPNPVKAEADARNRWDKGQQVKDKGLGKDPGRGLATPGPLEQAKVEDWKGQEAKRKGNAGEPAATAKPPEPEKKKEPWQMTKAEYKASAPENEQGSLDKQQGMQNINLPSWHEAYVRAAVLRGEKVPKEVIAEYPSLQKEIKDKNKKRLSSDQSTLTNIIKRSGGIRSDDASFKAHFGSIKEAMEYGISLGIFNKHAKVGLDQMAQSMVYEGHLIVPEGEDPVPYLVEGLMKKARSAAEDLTNKYDKAFEEYSKQQEEAYRESLAESDIEEAIRLGEIDANAAAAKDPNGISNTAADLDFDFGENTSKPKEEAIEKESEPSVHATALEESRSKGEPDPSTKEEYLKREMDWLKKEYPDNDEDVYRDIAKNKMEEDISSEKWKPQVEKGKYSPGDTVDVGGEAYNYRGQFRGDDGKQYAVVAGGKGGQISVPFDQVNPPAPPEAPKPVPAPAEKPAKKSMAGLPAVEGITSIKRHPEHEYNGIKIVELPNGEKHNIYKDPATQAWYHEGSQTPGAGVTAGYLGFDSANALERLVEGAKSGKYKPNSKE